MRKVFFKTTIRLAALCSLLSAPPLLAVVPVKNLPGVVDADHWKKRPAKKARPKPPKKESEPPPPIPMQLTKAYDMIQALNQIPDSQLTEKSGLPFRILEDLREEDAPDFSRLKQLLGRSDVRQPLRPGTKGMFADLLSARWDAFTLSGNLWLAALKSKNPEIQAKARLRLPSFIQPAHIPALISLLTVPGPNVLAYEILQDVTGQKFEPNPKKWLVWWKTAGGKADIVGHQLNAARRQLKGIEIRAIDPAAFWYAPAEIARTDVAYNERFNSEKNAIGRWNDAARLEIKGYIEQWDGVKPLFERIIHQPDPRVSGYLRSLVGDPGLGDYASVILAWRGDKAARALIEKTRTRTTTVGRLLAMGTLGDKNALQNLLDQVAEHKNPLSYPLMDEQLRGYAMRLPGFGVISAEQAFELLAHERFGLVSAATAKEKKKAFKKAKTWLAENLPTLTLDKKHGYYIPAEPPETPAAP